MILVVGREPNAQAGIVVNEYKGEYDWDKSSSTRSCFWAVAQEAFAYGLGKTPREIKEIFKEKRASPIISAYCALDGSGQQNKSREYGKQDRTHIENLIKHSDILQRVKCAWFCGLNDESFGYFKEEIIKRLTGVEKSNYFNLPYLSRRHNGKYKNYIDRNPEVKEKIEEIYGEMLK